MANQECHKLMHFVMQADAIFCGPAGVAMVTLADSANSKGGQSLLGDILCLLSSLLYAMYTIAIRRMLPDDCQANVAGLFGLVGLLNLVCMAPVLVLLWSVSLVQLQGLTAWLVFLVICKGTVSYKQVHMVHTRSIYPCLSLP